MTGIIYGLLLFLFRQYYITKFLSENYNEFGEDLNAKYIIHVVFTYLQRHYFTMIRPSHEARLEVKCQKDDAAEEEKKSHALSVTDEEDVAQANASSGDEKSTETSTVKKRKKSAKVSIAINDDQITEQALVPGELTTFMQEKNLSPADWQMLSKYLKNDDNGEKKSLAKRQKTVRSKRMTDVSYPALPSPRETRANNRGMRKSE